MGTSLKKYNLQGEELGHVSVSADLSEATVNSQLVKDYIVALRANARQWSACTKTRSEMSHTTKKPHPQKGQGRSRQGCLVAPQYRGGGRVFGPKPKPDFHVRINQQEKRAAIRALVAEKIRDGQIVVVDSLQLEAPKTKVFSTLMKRIGIGPRVLVIGEGVYSVQETGTLVSLPSTQYGNTKLSLRNIPRARFSLAKDVDGYSLAVAQGLIVTEAALRELEEWLVETIGR